MIVKCKLCKKEFITYPARIADGRGKYCSKKCMYLGRPNIGFWTGKKRWTDTLNPCLGRKEPIKTTKKRIKKLKRYYRTHTQPWTGKIRTLEHRKNLGKSLKGKFIGNKHPLWKGGRTIGQGYVFIYSPKHPFRDNKKYVAEHRLVIENQLKRFLDPRERVHHINGIKIDNRPQNLIGFINEAAHQRFHGGEDNTKYIVFDGRTHS